MQGKLNVALALVLSQDQLSAFNLPGALCWAIHTDHSENFQGESQENDEYRGNHVSFERPAGKRISHSTLPSPLAALAHGLSLY